MLGEINMNKRHKLFLIVGLTTIIISRLIIYNTYDSFLAFSIFTIIQLISYSLILSVIALIVALIRRNIKRYWFPCFALLALFAGIFDVCVKSYTAFYLEPRINQGIDELFKNGKIDLPEFDPRERLLGHWASEDKLTHFYFKSDGILKIDNLNNPQNVKYETLEFSASEGWIEISVSGADYAPHTRKIIFIDKNSAWQIVETEYGNFKSKIIKLPLDS
jgi:hypothetical protein